MRSRIFPILILMLLGLSSACASASLPDVATGTSSPIPHTIPTATVPPTTNPPTPGNEPAVIWKRTGGIAGMCQVLTIEFSGNYMLQDCKSNSQLASGVLTPEQMTQLNTYLSQYEKFQWESTPPQNSADMFNDQLTFNGQGSTTPTPEEQEAVNQYVALLVAELRGSATTVTPASSASESGIQGQVTIGPACPGPVRIDNPCPDRPFQTTFIILDPNNQVVTQVQTDEQGNFRVVLPPGTYTLHTASPTPMPPSGDQTVTVAEGQFTQVNIVFDSGMR
jgi:hypothetical protein